MEHGSHGKAEAGGEEKGGECDGREKERRQRGAWPRSGASDRAWFWLELIVPQPPSQRLASAQLVNNSRGRKQVEPLWNGDLQGDGTVDETEITGSPAWDEIG